ncbi:MAG: DUF5683 domain-containing protein [Bacteroidales bacterium]|jgi:TM2 domain-containing membrane protein YozV|nr:DUF5683 domain-containing protein [Bacteroidales bacterium]
MARFIYFILFLLMFGVATAQKEAQDLRQIGDLQQVETLQDVQRVQDVQNVQQVLADDSTITEDGALSDDITQTVESSTDTVAPAAEATLKPIKKIHLSFAEQNSGAFKLKKSGGRKSPWTAAICSAIIPGLGQMYIGQYWKPAIWYGGGAALWYMIDFNLKERRIYDRELNARFYKDTSALNISLGRFSESQLLNVRNYYQNNIELAIIIASAVYLLNILDAVVYAHLSKFDISPDLSMKIDPYARTNFYTKSKMPLDAGLSVCLTFK